MKRYATVLLMQCLAAVAWAGESGNTSVIGSDPSLAAGARALQLGQYETGVELTQQGLNSARLFRDRASAFSNLCAGLLGLNRFDEALEACDEALALTQRNWRVYNNRAIALLKSGQLHAARESLQKGLALNPDSPTLAKVAALIDAETANGQRIVSSGDSPHTH